MENKLSEQQVERAAEAMANTFTQFQGLQWCSFADDAKCHYRNMARAAAPYLQFPIAEPSEEEVANISNEVVFMDDAVETIIRNFVARRNAALMPKPDPRREAICNVVLQDGRKLSGAEADAVLAALEEVQK